VRVALALFVSSALVAGGMAACGSFGSADPDGPELPEGGLDGAPGPDGTTGTPTTDGAPTDDGGTAEVDAGAVYAPCNGEVACDRVVFVTLKEFFPTSIGGVSGAHARCTQAANAGSAARVKGRTFRAWFSDGASNAAGELVHGTGAYVLPDGTTVATSWTDLTDQTLLHAIDQDENGQKVTASFNVWTGTNAAGGAAPANCDNWLTNLPSATGTIGLTTSTGIAWTNRGTVDSCDQQNHLYCIEQ
jgi:hypothetical protein